MITIKEFMEVIEYKINDGSEYQWHCYGHNAYHIGHDNIKTGVSINIVFDTVDQTVYEMQAWDGANGREYRWINPAYATAHDNECLERHVSLHTSCDERNFINLEAEEDILEKAAAIFKGIDYDDRIIVKLNLTEEEECSLMRMAHDKDMSLNKFVEYILKEEMRKYGIEI
jgi:hypothetical protein